MLMCTLRPRVSALDLRLCPALKLQGYSKVSGVGASVPSGPVPSCELRSLTRGRGERQGSLGQAFSTWMLIKAGGELCKRFLFFVILIFSGWVTTWAPLVPSQGDNQSE